MLAYNTMFPCVKLFVKLFYCHCHSLSFIVIVIIYFWIPNRKDSSMSKNVTMPYYVGYSYLVRICPY